MSNETSDESKAVLPEYIYMWMGNAVKYGGFPSSTSALNILEYAKSRLTIEEARRGSIEDQRRQFAKAIESEGMYQLSQEDINSLVAKAAKDANQKFDKKLEEIGDSIQKAIAQKDKVIDGAGDIFDCIGKVAEAYAILANVKEKCYEDNIIAVQIVQGEPITSFGRKPKDKKGGLIEVNVSKTESFISEISRDMNEVKRLLAYVKDNMSNFTSTYNLLEYGNSDKKKNGNFVTFSTLMRSIGGTLSNMVGQAYELALLEGFFESNLQGLKEINKKKITMLPKFGQAMGGDAKSLIEKGDKNEIKDIEECKKAIQDIKSFLDKADKHKQYAKSDLAIYFAGNCGENMKSAISSIITISVKKHGYKTSLGLSNRASTHISLGGSGITIGQLLDKQKLSDYGITLKGSQTRKPSSIAIQAYTGLIKYYKSYGLEKKYETLGPYTNRSGQLLPIFKAMVYAATLYNFYNFLGVNATHENETKYTKAMYFVENDKAYTVDSLILHILSQAAGQGGASIDPSKGGRFSSNVLEISGVPAFNKTLASLAKQYKSIDGKNKSKIDLLQEGSALRHSIGKQDLLSKHVKVKIKLAALSSLQNLQPLS